jgi:hypothetical protein
MTRGRGGEILAALQDARQALVTPDLASIRRAQECLCAAEASLRGVREDYGAPLAADDWGRLRRELSLIDDFVLGVLSFFGAATDERQAATAGGRSCVTGACVSWSG